MEHTIRAFKGEKVIGKVCTRCCEWKPLSQYSQERKAGDGLKSQCKSCKSKSYGVYSRSNRDLFKDYQEQRKEMVASLPSDITSVDLKEIMGNYDYRCCLTGERLDSSALHLDHIVPYSVGHVGNVHYNVWPITGSLNMSKGNKNVFQWARERAVQRGDIDLMRFYTVMNDIAASADLTLAEYESFITWCHDNPRTAEEAREDKRHSIEIWRARFAISLLFTSPIAFRSEGRAV